MATPVSYNSNIIEDLARRELDTTLSDAKIQELAAEYGALVGGLPPSNLNSFRTRLNLAKRQLREGVENVDANTINGSSEGG